MDGQRTGWKGRKVGPADGRDVEGRHNPEEREEEETGGWVVACLPTAVCTSADVLQLFLGVLVFFSPAET